MNSPSYRHALYTVDQVRALDRRAIDEHDIPGYELMRRAAWVALSSLRRHWPEARRLAIYAGKGNNGGDAFLVAALAREAGLDPVVFAINGPSQGDAATARETCEAVGVRVIDGAVPEVPGDTEVIVDGLFGTGLKRAPEGETASLISRINASGAPVLALDVPSGIDADTGRQPGVAIQAAVTVTFIAGKRGLVTGKAPARVGVLEVDALGLPDSLRHGVTPFATVLQPRTLPPRDRDANKGNNGHVLAIGGDHGTAGAIRLCGEAALRTGAGLVSLATQQDNLTAIVSARPELMPCGVDGPQALQPMLDKASVLAIGPGLGQGAWGHALWLTALDAGKPLVLDADGLNLLAQAPRRFTHPAVLTPHPGEAGRLLGCKTADIEADRYAAVAELARRYGAVAVLKGAGSLIADPDGAIAVCPWGNPGMATGGMGDLLTGIIAGLLAQGLQAFDAACLGVGLHARAGDAAAEEAGERGLAAMDLLSPLRKLLNGMSP